MHLIILQCDEIFSNIEGDAHITRWRPILNASKVYHIFGLSVDAATDNEQNVVTNNYKLFFMLRTRLFGIIDDCQDISYQDQAPFVLFINVPRRLRTSDNAVGTNCLHSKVC